MTTVRHLQHLFWRAGFGLDLPLRKQLERKSPRQWVDHLFKDSQSWSPLQVTPTARPNEKIKRKDLSKEEKKALKKEVRALVKDLNLAWIQRMASGEGALREKMTLYWHDHFACRLKGIYLVQLQNNCFREHALGNFRDMLMAVAKDPGMLQFLNNQQNRKAHPNENFARELLELFTMGRGHYSEKDIQEAARAFTGWCFNFEGEFVFRKNQHDYGSKTFLGQTGDWDGDDIIRIVLEQPQTAQYLTEKIARYFVGPKLSSHQVDQWAQSFFKQDYDIGFLVREILSSAHFYSEEVMGTRIKSPVEYLVGMMRQWDMEFDSEQAPLFIQKLLGQVLFFPPNVAGWPEGTGWIDSSTMLARMKIPQALIVSDYLDLQPKGDFAGNEDLPRTKIDRKLSASINWKPMEQAIQGKNDEQAISFMADYLLQVDPKRLYPGTVTHFIKGQTREDQLKFLVMRLSSSPEYQLC